MTNNVVLVGKIYSNFVKGKLNNTDVLQVKLAIPRSYKNEEGIYETDIIPVILSASIADNAREYLKVGDVIAVKGSILSTSVNGKISLYVTSEKISFLASNKGEEHDD